MRSSFCFIALTKPASWLLVLGGAMAVASCRRSSWRLVNATYSITEPITGLPNETHR